MLLTFLLADERGVFKQVYQTGVNGPLPRKGEMVDLPGYHTLVVKSVTYQYGERGLSDCVVRLRPYRQGDGD